MRISCGDLRAMPALPNCAKRGNRGALDMRVPVGSEARRGRFVIAGCQCGSGGIGFSRGLITKI